MTEDPYDKTKITAKKVSQAPEEQNYICMERGPLVLSADSRLGKSADSVFEFVLNGDGTADGKLENRAVAGIDSMVLLSLKEKNGAVCSLVDYQSAGRDWKTKIAAWLPTKPEI